MRKLIAPIVVAVALVPAALAVAAPAPKTTASADCKAQLKQLGAATFKATYAPSGSAKSAYGKCVSRMTLLEKQNVQNAAKACRAEQADTGFAATHDGKTFDAFYGTGHNGKNAFGKCVSMKAKAASAQDQKAIVSGAKACKAERRDPNFAASHDGKTFAQFYANGKRNAFAKCVAAKAAAAQQTQSG